MTQALREALEALLEVADGVPQWHNAGHAVALGRAALATLTLPAEGQAVAPARKPRDLQELQEAVISAAAKALATPAQPLPQAEPTPIPQGWVLVPKVLTHEMLIRGGEAFFDATGPDGDDGDSLNDQDHARSIFEAMLAAAAQAGEGESE